MENTKYIADKLKELDDLKKLTQDIQDITYQLAFSIKSGLSGTPERLAKDNLSRIFNEKLDSLISQALEHGYTQGKKDTVEEVVREIELNSLCQQCTICGVENTTVLDCADTDCQCHIVKVRKLSNSLNRDIR